MTPPDAIFDFLLLSPTGATPPPRSGSQDFDLPLKSPAFDPRSWETGIRLRVAARVSGAPIYTTEIDTGLVHQSADLTDIGFDNPVLRTDPPGDYPGFYSDDRPTGRTDYYDYDITRRSFHPSTTNTKVGESDHGELGAWLPVKVHSAKTFNFNFPVVAGGQLFWVRPRETYKNTNGANIGRFDIAPKSPNLDVTLNIPPPPSATAE